MSAESVGQKLRQAREARNLSLEGVAQTTFIRLRYLQALETGQIEELPSPAQVRGFLRTFARHVGLQADALLAELEDDSPTSPAVQPSPSPAAEPSPQTAPPIAAIFQEFKTRPSSIWVTSLKSATGVALLLLAWAYFFGVSMDWVIYILMPAVAVILVLREVKHAWMGDRIHRRALRSRRSGVSSVARVKVEKTRKP